MIAADGLAVRQIADLYNYWQRVRTAGNQTYEAACVVIRDSLGNLPADAIPVGGSYGIVFGDSSLLADATMRLGVGKIPAGLSSINVAGHSLGGHLSMAFTRLFPGLTTDALAVNGLGFKVGSATVNDLFSALGGTGAASFNAAQIQNVYGIAGPEFAAMKNFMLQQPGGYKGIYIESASPGSPIYGGHGASQMTDSLALYSIYAKLAPGLSLDSITQLLQSASPTAERTLESALDALRKLLTSASAADTVTGDRNSLYTNLSTLQDSAEYKVLKGGAIIKLTATQDASTLATNAKSDFGAFLAVKYLLPVAIEGSWGVLGTIHTDLYTQWQADKALTLEQRKQGQANFSDEYLADRAAFLTWKNKLALLDKEAAAAPYTDAPDAWFRDYATSLTIHLGATTTDSTAKPRYLFGADQASGVEMLEGGSNADRIYGGAGEDRLYGYASHDHLEGGAGDDQLEGGDGNDVLVGGVGNDTLTGGKDNDTLRGGAGLDTYEFASGDGWDWIEDTDGLGRLTYAGLDLVGGANVAANAWKQTTPDGKTFLYSLETRTENGQTFSVLTIQAPGAGGGIRIKGWQPGQLGIDLADAVAPPILPPANIAPATRQTAWYGGEHAVIEEQTGQLLMLSAVGDYGEVQGDGQLIGNGSGNYLYERVGGGSDELRGEGGRDSLIATGGNDRLFGGDDDDVLHGGDDDDLLEGGEGSDVLAGGSGADVLMGGNGADFLFGTGTYYGARSDWSFTYDAGTNTLVAHQVFGAPFLADDAADLLRGGAGNDFLYGGGGADQLFGEADDDRLEGSAGDDYLSGGDGADILRGDMTEGAGMPNPGGGVWHNPPEFHGNDILDGGAGDDRLYGAGGADELRGGDGDDELSGDDAALPIAYQGADLLEGGAGNDRLWGYGGNDRLLGGIGDDTLIGDAADVAAIDHGNDWLDGGAGNDTMNGDGDGDELFGGAGNDRLFGDGDDIPVAQQGDDYLDGGAGDDYLRGYGGDDTLIGGEGIDELLAEAGNDALDGGAGDDVLDAGEGDDTVDGGAGDDGLFGGAGKDTLTGGAGADNLWGEEGDDVYVFNVGDGPTNAQGAIEAIHETSGNDTVRFGAGIAPDAVEALSANSGAVLLLRYGGGDQLAIVGGIAGAVENFEFADGTRLSYAQLIGRTSAVPMSAVGEDGAHYELGGRENDALTGLLGRTTLAGGRGDDTFTASGGNNTYLYEAGDGADRIADTSAKVDANGDPAPNVLRFGAGIRPEDLSLSLRGDALVLSIGGAEPGEVAIEVFDKRNPTASPSIDRFEFADETNLAFAALLERVIHIAGTANGDASIEGTAANDTIDAGAGADVVYGWEGNDVLIGGAGNDYLYDDEGDDRLDGGAQDDMLRGGMGNDTFVFGRGYGRDTVNAYDPGVGFDVIELTAGVAAEDITLWRLGDDLMLRIKDTGDSVTVQAHFRPELSWALDGLRFADGTFWDRAALEARITPVAATAGNDSLILSEGDDVVDALTGNDTLYGRGGNDWLKGGEGNDVVWGENGDDTLEGNAGNDTLEGGAGDDVIAGGLGADRIVAGEGNDIIVFNRGDGYDTVSNRDATPDRRDVIRFGPGISRSDLKFTRETINSVDWLRIAIGPSAGDRIDLDDPFSDAAHTGRIDALLFDDGSEMSFAEIKALLIAGTAGDDILKGYHDDDVMDGGGGTDSIYGYAGDDTLSGGAGYDSLYGGAGNDVYRFGRGHGVDSLTEGDGSVNGGTDEIRLDTGIDMQAVSLVRTSDGSGADDLVLVLDGGGEQLRMVDYFDATQDRRVERIAFADGAVWTTAEIQSNTVDRSGTPNTMTGTAGNDTFVVDHRQDQVVEQAGQGVDTIESGVSYVLPGNVENLTLTGVLSLSGYGNSLNNTIRGNAGSNFLDGRGGDDDVLIGGRGDDRYVVGVESEQFWNARVVELAGEGTDTVTASLPHGYTLPDHVENLNFLVNSTQFATTYRVPVYGNALNNVISVGGAWASPSVSVEIDGGVGADTLIGSRTNDTYVVDNPGDTVVETGGANGGYDTVKANFDYVLAPDIESLVLTGSAAASGTGNALNNSLDGSQNPAANRLAGGLGNDTYLIGAGDTVVELPGEGLDAVTVVSGAPGATFSLADYANVESLAVADGVSVSNLRGTGSNDTLTGNRSTNHIWGEGGDDLVYDAATEAQDFSAVDILEGGDGNDRLVSRSGADILDGGTGNDILESNGGTYRFAGNFGDDIVRSVSNTSRMVFSDLSIHDATLTREGDHLIVRGPSGSGTVTVENHFTYADVWQIAFADAVLNNAQIGILVAQGNATTEGDDVVLGTSETDVLSLLGGNDLAWGGAGDDTVAGGDGDDTLRGGAGADALSGDGGNDQVWGGDGDDTLAGGDGDDSLRGEAGADRLIAGAGNDWLDGGEGMDRLEGGGGTAYLSGGVGDDMLIAGIGETTMYGGDGADTYLWRLGDGADRISAGSDPEGTHWTDVLRLGAGIEPGMIDLARPVDSDDLELRVRGTSDVITLGGFFSDYGPGAYEIDEVRFEDGTVWTFDALMALARDKYGTEAADTLSGDGGDNRLFGLGGNDTLNGLGGNDWLDGGAGNDTLRGGTGDDQYVVDSTSDVVTENANEGTDTVHSSVTWTLGNNVERLTLTGMSAINGTGNSLANTITGNSAANTLSGGTGADSLIGGAGNDTYVVDNAGDTVTELAGEGADLVQSSVTCTLSAEVENLTLTGTAAINGTGNALANILTGNSGVNTLTGGEGDDRLDGKAGADRLNGGLGNDTYVVDNTGDVVTEGAGQGIDAVESSVTLTLAANVENLTLTGTGAINGTGNALDNVLVGNSGRNTLSGGAGNDTYFVGTGDTVTESANQGIDIVNSGVTWTLGSNLEVLALTGNTAINGTGNTLSNLLRGNTANNTLTGGSGVDLLEGGAGNDTLSDSTASDRGYFNGGSGTDTLTGGSGAEMFIGGTGNDTLNTGSGADVIAFNLGDGQDAVTSATGQDNTLSLGGGIRYADITLSRSGANLVVGIGATDRITLNNWYAGTPVRSVLTLQMVAEAMADFDDNGSDPLRDDKLETFDFAGLVNAFDTALAANPGLSNWAITNALTSFHLSGSDTAAIGGDLAWQYGRYGNLANVGLAGAQNVLGNVQFGTAAQSLQPLAGLQEGVVRLS